MTGPQAKTCATCGRVIAAHAVYYRFSLVLEGEQDLLDPSDDLEGNPAEALAEMVRRLDEGSADPGELEAQVHWERTGVVCSECRAVAMRMLNIATGDSGPH
ncbi:hypothetical protein HJC10_08630 [Corallococcus exiguus]|uniref:hypothetical protein n=1 Tax=Corallococcus TaxID=83461 RepID=UPI000EBF7754|nr:MULTISPECIES: hypothetical protein [Corallococcus]NNB85395.1 hypothetical protein [Corallococcus exiguus]NNB93011.1 hypothetical protein [Corallococcus exiguus]NNC02915.1 hypothetical protein [Corallococcus exiguus]NPC46755.1 hypothetical protein [Corallococcus exiguus]RKH86435.1 hypothetical protein D7X99_03240 [Corallococcus sp. AB032C]